MGAPGTLWPHWPATGSRSGDGGFGRDWVADSLITVPGQTQDSTSGLSCVPNAHGMPDFPDERGGQPMSSSKQDHSVSAPCESWKNQAAEARRGCGWQASSWTGVGRCGKGAARSLSRRPDQARGDPSQQFPPGHRSPPAVRSALLTANIGLGSRIDARRFPIEPSLEPISREEKMSMPAGSRQRSLMTEFSMAVSHQMGCMQRTTLPTHTPGTQVSLPRELAASSRASPPKARARPTTATSIRSELSLQSLLCTPSRQRRLDPNPGIRSRKKQTLATVDGARTASLGPPPPPGITPKERETKRNRVG